MKIFEEKKEVVEQKQWEVCYTRWQRQFAKEECGGNFWLSDQICNKTLQEE